MQHANDKQALLVSAFADQFQIATISSSTSFVSILELGIPKGREISSNQQN